MTGSLLPLPFFKDWDSSGSPLAFGTVTTYEAGTTTPIATYTSAGLSQVNPNPVPLNNRGEAQIWVNPSSGNIKILVQDIAGNQIRIVDNIPPPAFLPVDSLNIHYDITPAETAAGVTPTNYAYWPGTPRRFGAVGNGTSNDTTAVQNAINSCDTYIGYPGDIYGVTSVTFPMGGPHHVDFNGSIIRGIASTATNCIVQLMMEGTVFIDYKVDGNFSQNYLCGTWWYNSTSSSQYNRIFGMRHTYLGGVQTSSGTIVRAMVYGALVGQTSTGEAQSENQVYGWNTRGCSNPFYSNHNNGLLHFSEPMFVCVAEEWPATGGVPNAPWSYANGRAFECIQGIMNVSGGEVQIASSGTTYACVMGQTFLEQPIIETNCPIYVAGDGARIRGGRYLNNSDTVAGFTIAADLMGNLVLEDVDFLRDENIGSFSANPLVDATNAGLLTFTAGISGGATSATLASAWSQTLGANYGVGGTYVVNVTFSDGEVRACTVTPGATTCTWTGGLSNTVTANAYLPFETVLDSCRSWEWRWSLIGGDVRLVQCSAAATVQYRNHRMNITASDPNVYTLNTNPTEGILDFTAFDHLGYTTNGWTETPDFGGGTTLAVTTTSGPTNYLASQLELTAPSGQQAIATYGNPASLATLKTSALFVRPGELYWVAAWCNLNSGNGKLSVRFFTIAGASVSDVPIADSGSLTLNTWKYAEGPVSVPATAAYMCVGLWANAGVIQITDLRVRRAA